MPALCIERLNCKLSSRKGAPLITVNLLKLTIIATLNGPGLRLDKLEQICGQWRIGSEDSGKMGDDSLLKTHHRRALKVESSPLWMRISPSSEPFF